MKTLELSRVHGTWLDLRVIQNTNGSNLFSLDDALLITNFSPEFSEAVSLAKLNDYTHINLQLSAASELQLDDLQIVQDDDVHLPVERALELIEVLSNSNYFAALKADEIFTSKDNAIAAIHSDAYLPVDGIELIFHRVNGEAESVVASFKRERWYLIDHGMGGTTTSHPDLITAIHRLREGISEKDKFSPVLFEQTEQQW